MPSIAHIANLWSLRGHPSLGREWSLETKIRAVAAEGFDGITGMLAPEHRPLAEKYGLEHLLGFISSSDPREFGARIRSQKAAGAVHINVQLDDHDTPPAVAAGHWLKLVRLAEKIGGVVLALEVHRDTCTETPEKTYEIAERHHRATGELIKLNFDFSHFAVVKHVAPDNYSRRLLDRPELLRNSEQVHLRPFNGHHCQVPVKIRGRLTAEARSYLRFVGDLMKIWASAKSNRDKILFACPEMGPHHVDGGGYNISGLPPAWPEAVALRAELDELWRRTLGGA